jgi:hypothetical protein
LVLLGINYNHVETDRVGLSLYTKNLLSALVNI